MSASVDPADSSGLAPEPYWSMTIGAALVPEPLGASCPVQLPPAFRQILLPGWKVTPLTLVRVFQAVAGDMPSLLSLPAAESR